MQIGIQRRQFFGRRLFGQVGVQARSVREAGNAVDLPSVQASLVWKAQAWTGSISISRDGTATRLSALGARLPY